MGLQVSWRQERWLRGGWTRRLDVWKVVLPVSGWGVLRVEDPRCAMLPTPSNSKGVPSPAPDGLSGRGAIMRVGLPLKVGGGKTPCGPAAGRPGYSAAPEAWDPNTLVRASQNQEPTGAAARAGSFCRRPPCLSQQTVPAAAVICDAARKGQSWEGQGSGPGL